MRPTTGAGFNGMHRGEALKAPEQDAALDESSIIKIGALRYESMTRARTTMSLNPAAGAVESGCPLHWKENRAHSGA